MESIFKSYSNAHVRSCPNGVRYGTYGRDVRRPIYDAVYGINSAVTQVAKWCMDIGLCVEDGKLCVIYDPNGGG